MITAVHELVSKCIFSLTSTYASGTINACNGLSAIYAYHDRVSIYGKPEK